MGEIVGSEEMGVLLLLIKGLDLMHVSERKTEKIISLCHDLNTMVPLMNYMADKYHLKKLPKIKDLNEEFSKVLEEKRREYAEYREAKAHMQEYLIAKQNIEALLNSENEAKKERNNQIDK